MFYNRAGVEFTLFLILLGAVSAALSILYLQNNTVRHKTFELKQSFEFYSGSQAKHARPSNAPNSLMHRTFSKARKYHIIRSKSSSRKVQLLSKQIALCNTDPLLVSSGECPQMSIWCQQASANSSDPCQCDPSSQYYYSWSDPLCQSAISSSDGSPGSSFMSYFYYVPNAQYFSLPDDSEPDEENGPEDQAPDEVDEPEQAPDESPEVPEEPSNEDPQSEAPSEPERSAPPPPEEEEEEEEEPLATYWNKPLGKISFDANGEPIMPVRSPLSSRHSSTSWVVGYMCLCCVQSGLSRFTCSQSLAACTASGQQYLTDARWFCIDFLPRSAFSKCLMPLHPTHLSPSPLRGDPSPVSRARKHTHTRAHIPTHRGDASDASAARLTRRPPAPAGRCRE